MIQVQAAYPRVPLDNNYTITYREDGRRQWERNGFIVGCKVCVIKWGHFYFSSFAFPVVFPLHSTVSWSLC